MEHMNLDGKWKLWHFLEGDREVGPGDSESSGSR